MKFGWIGGGRWGVGVVCAGVAMLGVARADAQPGGDRDRKNDRPGLLGRMASFQTETPEHAYDIILVNPTRTSVGVSVVSYADVEGYVEMTGPAGSAPARTAVKTLKAGEPTVFTVTGLREDTGYTYTWWSRKAGAKGTYVSSDAYSFHTTRAEGSPFVFTVIADSHLDGNMSTAVYERSLAGALADHPDFHLDLGDTFMTDKRGKEFRDAAPQYVAQRYYMGKLCHSAPLFMTLGNHDGEWGYANGGSGGRAGESSVAGWSFVPRTKYFPAPEIKGGGEYSGRTAIEAGRGANYYTFTWGDARLIVLDPFWYTDEKMRGPGGRGGGAAPESDTALSDQGWTMTLGREQYEWLTRTLEASRSRHTFVFIHHLVGGLGRSSRGGAEAAGYFEWGGKNADGTNGFAAHRPGWRLPIHDLLVKHHVSAVFHGHDHLYVREELDGMVYQCTPQPGNINGGTRSAAEYGYRSGKILGSPGYLRVSVSQEKARIELVRPEAERGGGGRSVADSYELPARVNGEK